MSTREIKSSVNLSFFRSIYSIRKFKVLLLRSKCQSMEFSITLTNLISSYANINIETVYLLTSTTLHKCVSLEGTISYGWTLPTFALDMRGLYERPRVILERNFPKMKYLSDIFRVCHINLRYIYWKFF